jgi:hypothetical protein
MAQSMQIIRPHSSFGYRQPVLQTSTVKRTTAAEQRKLQKAHQQGIPLHRIDSIRELFRHDIIRRMHFDNTDFNGNDWNEHMSVADGEWVRADHNGF